MGIEITPYPVSTALPFDQSQFNLPLAKCKGYSNSPYGELRYTVQSLNQGHLKREYGAELIPYELYLGPLEIPLDGTSILMRKGVELNRFQDLSISYDLPPNQDLVPGRYKDTLTFSSQGGETISILEVCGEFEEQ